MSTFTLDPQTFTALVMEHQAALYRTARSLLSNPQDAEDAVQQAICAAFAHREQLREPEKFKAWLLRILVNTCYEQLRRQRRTVELSAVEDTLTAPGQDPTESISLWQAVLALPEPMRYVVTLFYYEDCTIAQTAQILNLSQGAVKTRLSRARDQLRKILTED